MQRTWRILPGLGLALVLLGCNLFSFGPKNFGATSTPTFTATFTASPVPSPTPTPIPIVRVGNGDKVLSDGDVDAASAQYRAAFNDTADPDIKAAALWGLARAQYLDQRYADALTTLRQLIADYPASPYHSPAYFLEGEALSQMQRYDEAAAAYQNYLSARPGVLDSYVQQLRGDALSAAGNDADALAAYQSAQGAPHLDDAQALQIKIAQARAKIGDYATALAMYDSISANTTNDYIRAQMDYLAGRAYLSLNQNENAYGRFRHAVENYPLSNYSYLGLVELVGADVPVDDLDRGLTDYFAGQYDVALVAFDRYIDDHPGDDGTAHYYRALTLAKLGNYQAAVDEFNLFISNYSSSSKWAIAWYGNLDDPITTPGLAFIQWYYLDLYPEAAQTLLTFVQTVPTSPLAPDYLMTAARIYERDGRFDQAAQVWQRVASEYPNYARASTALFFAGIMQYRQADYSAALDLFEQSLVKAAAPEDQARAYLWIGKAQQKLGDANQTQLAWQQAQNADPGGYYSERARDLLAGRAPFTPPLNMNLNLDLAAERKDADAWTRLTFNLPADTDLTGLGPLASDPRIMRGRELWDLGEYDDAHQEFEDLRCELAYKDNLNCYTLEKNSSAGVIPQEDINRDAVLTYRFANYLIDLGVYDSGIRAARQVLTLAGLDDHTSSMMAPPYFSHIRYGLYYTDLILPAAQNNGFDPLFLFSTIRLESLFGGFARSTAGARGLMQILPSTGASIANSMGWPINYNPDQLYRPNVSIAMGAYYLAANRKLLGGDIYAALAAYNGGPGNAVEWQRLSGGDPDLFVEAVRFDETRNYIRSIYEIYVIYRRLYGLGP